MMTCECRHTYENGERAVWTVNYEIAYEDDRVTEIDLVGRGTALTAVVVELEAGGRFLCLPSLDVGSQLAAWTDYNWNFEKLSQKICETDAATICRVLYDIGQRRLES